ncbi:MAG: bifunctional nicotinamidase/pyrazinamidase [Treponema sp.]|nr:bifunctional nicotinamidase/pyrazinamidase [Treponema sp.]
MTLNAARTLLLEIDVQNDFCSGALAVQNAVEVIPPLNALAAAVTAKGGCAAATQDWHPWGHSSFASSYSGKSPGDIIDTETVNGQVLWPDHCIQGSWGAAFHEQLNLDPVSFIIRKGLQKTLDSYSAFFENDRRTPTGLEGLIRGLGIETVIIGGLATDYCVFYSAMDCKRLGLATIIAGDAVRGVDFPAGSVDNAVKEMKKNGIEFISSAELIGRLK